LIAPKQFSTTTQFSGQMFYLFKLKHLPNMTSTEILKARLLNQQIASHQFETPGEIVKWMGAMQAQDYLSALYAVGLRMKKSTDTSIEQAITNKTIVRTWPMRGTLHFVAPEDAKWMLALLTPRIIARAASTYRNSGLDKNIFLKSRKVIIKALEGGKQLERKEIYQVLEKAKISTSDYRGLHIIGLLAQEGVLCFGPRLSKQQGFVLLDEWIPFSKKLEGDEALAELANRYFTSHGPATVQDFVWWSGLTITAATKGLELVKKNFISENINSQMFWMSDDTSFKVKNSAIYLLPAFDEYLVGYKDRSAALDTKYTREVLTINGIFNPSLIINGKIEGTWKRTITKNEVLIQIASFKTFNQLQKAGIAKAAKHYGRFLNMEVKLQY
jgi:hypothetical protein